jgi:hypothetical protein
MRFFSVRSLALATLVPALVLVAVVPGCAKQSEGERCGYEQLVDNEDCDDGLVCVSKTTLLDNSVNRCCYANRTVSDSRCEPAGPGTGPTAGAGGGGGAGTAGGSGTAGSPEAGGEGG